MCELECVSVECGVCNGTTTNNQQQQPQQQQQQQEGHSLTHSKGRTIPQSLIIVGRRRYGMIHSLFRVLQGRWMNM